MTPMRRPAAMDEKVPIAEMPPFVPLGTRFPVVMRIGSILLNMPSSEAHVSPLQQA